MSINSKAKRFLAHVTSATLVCVIVWVVLTMLQRWMLFPRHAAPEVPNAGANVVGLERLWVETPEGKVEAWYLPGNGRSADSPGPAVVFAHGNAELIDYLPPFVSAYQQMGVGVLLIEYRGYGRSAGKPTQVDITQDAVAFYDQLVARPDVDPKRIVFHGRSLGGGVVCSLAEARQPAALILQSTFTSVVDMAKGYLLPEFLVSDPFHNLNTLRTLDCPVLIVHGQNDTMIPYSHAEQLNEVAPNSRLIGYPCNHNDCPPDNALFWRDVRSFLTEAGI